jgi:hypothetical protein
MILPLLVITLAWTLLAAARLQTVSKYLRGLIDTYHQLCKYRIHFLYREASHEHFPLDYSEFNKSNKLLSAKLAREIETAWSWSWKLWLSSVDLRKPGESLIEETKIRFCISGEVVNQEVR